MIIRTLSVPSSRQQRPVAPLGDGKHDFAAALRTRALDTPTGRTEKNKDPAVSKLRNEAEALLVLHTINNETRTALREAKNVGSGSRLLARIARLMKDYDDADRARFDEHRKRTIPASELARAKDELDYNRLNVAADDKLFADALHAVDDMPDSRYRQKILDILYQPFRGPGSPIRYRSNAAGPWLTRVHHTPQRRRPGNG